MRVSWCYAGGCGYQGCGVEGQKVMRVLSWFGISATTCTSSTIHMGAVCYMHICITIQVNGEGHSGYLCHVGGAEAPSTHVFNVNATLPIPNRNPISNCTSPLTTLAIYTYTHNPPPFPDNPYSLACGSCSSSIFWYR